jgi:hypothetical protein
MAVSNTGYMADNGATPVTITLPVSSAMTVGDVIQVNGVGSGGWKITRNALQSIIINGISTNSGVTGVISGSQYAAIELQYIGSNIWTVLNYTGNVGVLLSSGYVYEGGLTWMPVSTNVYQQAGAVTLCEGVINGVPGWRLPTEPELMALYSTYPNDQGGWLGNSLLTVQGWSLYYTWSSTPSSAGNHYIVYLNIGYPEPKALDSDYSNVTCVR